MARVKLPENGCSEDELFSQMTENHKGDANWKDGRTWSMVYNSGEKIMEVVKRAYLEFMVENGLGPTTYPSLRRFETEVISMTAHLLGGDEAVVGTMTSGGTESILMAVKTARDLASESRGIKLGEGEILMPSSAHPAFCKAAHYLGLHAIQVPVGEDLRADVQAMEHAITDKTVMMVGSAPGYPHGVVDPIEALSRIAHERNIWFHTDACLGGFLLPFVRKLGYPVPAFDFSLPGVTSVSADVHKYGFAAKGASTVLYRDEKYRHHQFYVTADWSGGIYATPALAGARTGGSIAGAWAVLNFLGEEGYLDLARRMMTSTKQLIAGINGIEGLSVLGEPEMTVFAFGSDTVNVYALAEALHDRKWHVERQHLPPSLHMMVSPEHDTVVDEFLADLIISTDQVRHLDASEIKGLAAMYGMMGTMPDRHAATEFVRNALSQLYNV